MNDSVDLRKRILKMRENNDFILKTIKSENFEDDINKEIKSADIKTENKENFSSDTTKKILAENKNNIKSSLLKNNVPTQDQKVNHNFNKDNHTNLVDTNEAQFRILANKFNEAVEVILELSDKVKRLENEIYKKQNNTNIGNGFLNYINLKILLFFILIPFLILGFFTLTFDFSTIKLILTDIILSI